MNNDIQEDYITFEVAKLLKEKGFAVRLLTYYRISGYPLEDTSNDNWNQPENGNNGYYYSRPTTALAIKWIRENFNYNVEIGYRNAYKDYLARLYPIQPNTEVHFCGRYKSHEEAENAAIEYVLKTLSLTN